MAFDTYTIKYFIKDHGTLITLRKVSKGAYDNATGKVTNTNTDYKTYGYSYKSVPDGLTDNSIVTSTRKVIISGVQKNNKVLPQPRVGDQVIVGGSTYDILRVYEVKDSSNTVIYTLDVKG